MIAKISKLEVILHTADSTAEFLISYRIPSSVGKNL